VELLGESIEINTMMLLYRLRLKKYHIHPAIYKASVYGSCITLLTEAQNYLYNLPFLLSHYISFRKSLYLFPRLYLT
jgi:hypothetical protein